MKTTNLILIIPFLFWSCIENKSSKTDTDTVENAINTNGVYAEDVLIYIVTDLILRDYYMADSALKNQSDTLLIKRVVNKEEINLRFNVSEEFEFGESYTIGKSNRIVADFNEDAKQDIIIPVRYEYGTSVRSDLGYLFLNTANGYSYVSKIEISQIAKHSNSNSIKNEFGMFVFEKTEGYLLVGSSYYFDKEDMPCCPTLFATEKYKYNLKTNNFERVYQSELKKKS
jgi:hypothetical protein